MTNKREKDYQRAVAFLDILGFSNYATHTPADAMNLLHNYHSLIKQKIITQKVRDKRNYVDEELKPLIEQRSIDSFENFLPFSDSIFITSKDSIKFVKQLSNFLLDCFIFTSSAYANPENRENPTQISINTIDIDGNGIINRGTRSANWYPLFFRCGIGYGDAGKVEINSIIDSKVNSVTTIVGPAVVDAVGLEKTGKGPRVFCGKRFIEKLDNDTKKYIVTLKANEYEVYELLWPAFYYIENNDCADELRNFGNLFSPAVNLWKAFNHLPYGVHYYSFLELLIKSTIRFAEIHNLKNEAIDLISSQIRIDGLCSKENVLLKQYK